MTGLRILLSVLNFVVAYLNLNEFFKTKESRDFGAFLAWIGAGVVWMIQAMVL